MTRSLESLLGEARGSIARVTPREAQAAVEDGALLVDTRSADEQREQGVLIPGALLHPLSVVLWRLEALPRETRVILVCRQATRPASRPQSSPAWASANQAT